MRIIHFAAVRPLRAVLFVPKQSDCFLCRILRLFLRVRSPLPLHRVRGAQEQGGGRQHEENHLEDQRAHQREHPAR